jgi:hypothetical protein
MEINISDQENNLRNRNPGTEEAYEYRVQLLYKNSSKSRTVDPEHPVFATPSEVVQDLIESTRTQDQDKKPQRSKASWSLYRSALLWHLSSRRSISSEFENAYLLLRDFRYTEQQPTSQQKKKKIETFEDADFKKLIATLHNLNKANYNWGLKAAYWLQAGIAAGARSGEWMNTSWLDREKLKLMIPNTKQAASSPAYARVCRVNHGIAGFRNHYPAPKELVGLNAKDESAENLNDKFTPAEKYAAKKLIEEKLANPDLGLISNRAAKRGDLDHGHPYLHQQSSTGQFDMAPAIEDNTYDESEMDESLISEGEHRGKDSVEDLVINMLAQRKDAPFRALRIHPKDAIYIDLHLSSIERHIRRQAEKGVPRELAFKRYYEMIHRELRAACRHAFNGELKYRLYTTRSHFAAVMKVTNPIGTVATMMGHSNTRTTMSSYGSRAAGLKLMKARSGKGDNNKERSYQEAPQDTSGQENNLDQGYLTNEEWFNF